ncbi:MAG: sulfatase-like hydrolase/transferase [Novosphingobium sp.]|nr:sulfatase-like hydrolase/transferase [Novosphingobium sp.]
MNGIPVSRFLTRPVLAFAVIGLVCVVELAIADRKYGVFSGGFGQSSAVDTAPEIAIFLAGYFTSQFAIAVTIWGLCARLNRRNGSWPALFHFSFAYGGLNLGLLNAQYQLHSYFSDVVDFALLKQLGGGSIKDALLFSKDEIALGVAALAVYLLLWWGCWRVARRWFPTAIAASQLSRGSKLLTISWLAFIAMLAIVPRTGSDTAHGLNRMLAWSKIGTLADLASDFDGDNYGLFGLRNDAYPFDSTRYPLALDIPGNGIDEDGYAGDLSPVAIPQPLPESVPPEGGLNLVLVIFESTRGDVLGKRLNGKLVAPNLAALAASGTAIAPSYSHVGFTTESLKSIFSGRLVPRRGDPSLFTELKKAGYGISVFSGQPEDFGDISATVGMRENADIFVDAERLKDKRAFGFAAQGSLLIDEAILLNEFDKALGTPEAWNEPQFVYMNFQSPHYPYHHEGVPRRFADPPVERSAISAENRELVERTYWNAVANADARLGELIARLKQLDVWERTILAVSGDHGEALFEDGFLGHGHIINQRQFATFFAVNRKLRDLQAPIAISDYRRTLLGLLQGKAETRRSQPPFMHIGSLEAPSTIGMATKEYGVVSLRLDTGKACFQRPSHCANYSKLNAPEREVIDKLVARWGTERWSISQAATKRSDEPEAIAANIR